jgi:HAD superfamily hydrolase (TIGR01450 family)
MRDPLFSGIKLALLDQDGTLYRGNRPLPGAVQFVKRLRESGIQPLFLSNNTSRPLAQTMKNLSDFGFEVKEHEVRDAGWATRAFLKREKLQRIALFAQPAVVEDFCAEGFAIDFEQPDAVVLAYDTTFTFDKLVIAHKLISQGVRFIATHPDRLCPTESGFVPDIGSMIDALRSAGSPEPLVIGKPSPTMVLPILREWQCDPKECLMVGDRLYTDIRMAEENGLRSLLVLTGEADRASLNESPWKPTAVVDSLSDLL